VARVTRKIGLSLGADVCWPKCYEEIVKNLDLEIRWVATKVRFEVERTSIEPFDLQAPKRYDLVIDRLTHWYPFQREWIKKSILLGRHVRVQQPVVGAVDGEAHDRTAR
jgi:hypothetical protein